MYYDHAVIVPLIIAITELAKRLGLPKRLAAIFAWLLGVVIAFVYVTPGNWKDALFVGSVLGLSAAGLFSGTRSILKK